MDSGPSIMARGRRHNRPVPAEKWEGKIFRLRLFDLVPVARDVLIEQMADGVLVVDARNRILDINPSARAMIGLGDAGVVGTSVDTVLAAWPHLVARYRDVRDARAEVLVDTRSGPRYLDLRISVTVIDTGPGLPPGLHDYVFDRPAVGRAPGRGSGLGLVFCRLAVEAHGGRIRAERGTPRGAVFNFTVPVATSESGDANGRSV